MFSLLSRLVQIPRGPTAPKALIEQVHLLQEAVKALARGDNLGTSSTVRRNPGSGSYTLDAMGGGKARGGGAITIEPTREPPLCLVKQRPAYVKPPAAPAPGGQAYFWLTRGTINGCTVDNWNEPIVAPVELEPGEDPDPVTTYVFAKVTLPTSVSLKVSKVEIVKGSTWDAFETPDWGANGARPGYAFFPLGWIEKNTSGTHVFASGAGNVWLSESITEVRQVGPTGESRLMKSFYWSRMNYL